MIENVVWAPYHRGVVVNVAGHETSDNWLACLKVVRVSSDFLPGEQPADL